LAMCFRFRFRFPIPIATLRRTETGGRCAQSNNQGSRPTGPQARAPRIVDVTSIRAQKSAGHVIGSAVGDACSQLVADLLDGANATAVPIGWFLRKQAIKYIRNII
jgi:hypothetical protein